MRVEPWPKTRRNCPYPSKHRRQGCSQVIAFPVAMAIAISDAGRHGEGGAALAGVTSQCGAGSRSDVTVQSREAGAALACV